MNDFAAAVDAFQALVVNGQRKPLRLASQR
jgi:hypothetical protein